MWNNLERFILGTKYILLFYLLSRVCVIFLGSFINPFNNNPTKKSNTLKQFVGCSQQIVRVCWIFCGFRCLKLQGKSIFIKIFKFTETKKKKVIVLSAQNRKNHCLIFFLIFFDVFRTAISSNITIPKGAILTTHSMEEVDALCNRVGIVVKGQLKYVPRDHL